MREFLRSTEADRLTELINALGPAKQQVEVRNHTLSPQSFSFSVPKIDQICLELAKFSFLQYKGRTLGDIVKDCQLQILEDCDQEELKRLWEACPPAKYAANKCWPAGTNAPSAHLVLDQALNNERKRGRSQKTCWVDGNTASFSDCLPLLFPEISKFTSPAKGHFCYILDIPADGLPALRLPEGHAEDGKATCLRPNSHIASSGALVDLHIDGGRAGFSALLQDCRKVWFLAPMTDRNGEIFASMKSSSRLLENLSSLEGCVVTMTTSDEVLYLPAGCLHATVTLERGYLTAIGFMTASAVRTAFKTFRVLLKVDEDEHLAEDLSNFCHIIQSALKSKEEQERAAEEWLKFGTTLLVQVRERTHEDFDRKSKRPWGEFAVQRIVATCTDALTNGFRFSCPCGQQYAKTKSKAHFEAHVLHSQRLSDPTWGRDRNVSSRKRRKIAT